MVRFGQCTGRVSIIVLIVSAVVPCPSSSYSNECSAIFVWNFSLLQELAAMCVALFDLNLKEKTIPAFLFRNQRTPGGAMTNDHTRTMVEGPLLPARRASCPNPTYATSATKRPLVPPGLFLFLPCVLVAFSLICSSPGSIPTRPCPRGGTGRWRRSPRVSRRSPPCRRRCWRL